MVGDLSQLRRGEVPGSHDLGLGGYLVVEGSSHSRKARSDPPYMWLMFVFEAIFLAKMKSICRAQVGGGERDAMNGQVEARR